MSDTLDRERLPSNLIDRVSALSERIRRLEELMLLGTTGPTIIVIQEEESTSRWQFQVETIEDLARLILVEL